VFSVYDTLFNVLFVAALLVGAVLLPASGVSVSMLIAVAVLYLLAALGYRSLSGGSAARFPSP
jgi:hypothetical protein